MGPYVNLFFVLLLAGLFRLFVLWTEGKLGQTSIPTYRRRVTLLTPAEQAFRDALLRAIPENVEVSYKVRLLDVIEGENPRDAAARNKVQSKHLDFVLVDRESSRVLAAIELDDASHLRADRVARDAFLEQAMKSAGVPLLRFRAAREYDVHNLATKIAEAYATTHGRHFDRAA